MEDSLEGNWYIGTLIQKRRVTNTNLLLTKGHNVALCHLLNTKPYVYLKNKIHKRL